MQVTPPLAAFRAIALATSAQAIITTTAPAQGNVPLIQGLGTGSTAVAVVNSLTASLYTGTAAYSGVVQLIDGTGTNVVWQQPIAANTSGFAALTPTGLNIPCYNGVATLQFNPAGTGAVVQGLSMSGLFQNYGGS